MIHDVLAREAKVAIEYATDHLDRMGDDELAELAMHANDLFVSIRGQLRKREVVPECVRCETSPCACPVGVGPFDTCPTCDGYGQVTVTNPQASNASEVTP